jgi:hypothetical protein
MPANLMHAHIFYRHIKRLGCFAVLLLAGLTAQLEAQEIALAESKMDVNPSTTKMHKLFAHDQDYYYVIRFYANQYYLEKLDQNLEPLLEEPIKLFQGINTFQLEGVIHFHNELYVFFSFTRIAEIVLYYQKIDKSTMKPYSAPVVLTTIHTIKGAWASFFFSLSHRETKLLIACRTKLTWRRDQYNEYYVYDEDLSLVWKRKDTYEFKGQGPRDNIYVVDDIGNISILSLLKQENIISLFRKFRNLYTIYRYTHEGNDFMEYPVTLEKTYIRDINIISGEQGELYCAGLYSESFDVGVRGTFFFMIDPATGRIYDRTLNPFDNALLTQAETNKEPMLQNTELVNYNITDMVLRSNGRIFLIAEQVFDQTQNTYNNLIVTCYDINGSVYWTRAVEKRQDFNYRTVAATGYELTDFRDFMMDTGYISANIENYCSYALLAPWDETGIVLFYNDHIRNLEQSGKRRSFNQPKKSYLLAVSIDEYGNMTKTPVKIWKKKANFPEPMRFYDDHHGTIVIPAFRYRKCNYLKIKADL